MFDRFTEKAIKAVLLAQEETRRLGHKFVGTEQILLGLIAEGTGIAAKVFQEMGIKLKTARIEVEKIIDRGSAELSEEIPFSPRAKIVLDLSLQEAEQLGHDYVGTEHLLLGLIREGDGVAIRVLENLRIKPPKVRTSVLRMLADEAEKYEEQLLVSQKLDNNVPEENSSPQPDSNLGELENLQPELASNIYAGLSVHPSSLVQAEVEVPDEWKVGDRLLNLYEVTDILGEGGFGKVYKVLHTGWNISLAVKTPRPEQLEAIGGVENFIREAETWVKLGLHPHIVTCFYVRKLGKSPRVFAEFVGGGSLHDWIYGKNGESPKLYEGGNAESFKRILDIAIQFAWGLHYSHEQGLIHQDVKPGNTMMTPDGTVKVTDFGLARARAIAVSVEENIPDRTLQVPGSGSGTPAYFSPEQYRQQTLTRRTDLWSWALSVLEMFKGGRRWDIGVKVTHAREFYILESEPLQENTPPLPQSVAELLWVCLREDPERRPRTMLDVANALKVIYQQEMGEAYPRPEPETGKDIADSLNNRAVSLLDLGQIEEAMHLWDRALEVNPLHPESTYNRGLILWRACRITDDILVKDLEKVRDANVENWNAHYLLALVHLERNNCEEAIKSLNQIPAEQAQQSEVQEALAEAQERLPNSNMAEGTFSGHTHPVISVNFSYDGSSAVSLAEGVSRPFIWDINTGHVKDIIGPTNEIPALWLESMPRSVCFSPNNRYILSGGFKLELWDISFKNSPLRVFGEKRRFSEPPIKSVCMSLDGNYVLSGSSSNILRLWNIETGECLQTFSGHTKAVESVCLSSDNNYAISGSLDGTIKRWDVQTGECLQTLEGHSSGVNSVCLSADGLYVLSGGEDKTLKLWHLETGECVRNFIGHTDKVNSVCISPDSQFAISGSDDDTVRLWDNITTGRCLHTFLGHADNVTSLCISPDGQYALSGSADTNLRLWRVNKPINSYIAPIRLCQVLTTETILSINQAYEQALAKARQALARNDLVGFAQELRNIRSQPAFEKSEELFQAWTSLYQRFPRKSLLGAWEDKVLLGHSGGITSVSLSLDGQYALSGSQDKTLKLWNMAKGECFETFEGHEKEVTSVFLSSDARYALSGSEDKTVKFWNVETGECLQTFKGHTNIVTSVWMSSDSKFALSGSKDWTLKLWDTATGHCLHTIQGHKNEVYAVSMTSDDRFVLSARGMVKFWETRTGELVGLLMGNAPFNVNSISLSLDNNYLLTGSYDGWVSLWDIAQSNLTFKIRAHTAPVTSVALSSDSRYAVSGSEDQTIKLWNLKSQECVRTFAGHQEKVTSVCFSLDGKYVCSSSLDKTIRIWILDWELQEENNGNDNDILFKYLEILIAQKTPYSESLPQDRIPTKKEVEQSLTRMGTPSINKIDIQNLAYILGCVGYGNFQATENEEIIKDFVKNCWQNLQIIKMNNLEEGKKELKIKLSLISVVSYLLSLLLLKFLLNLNWLLFAISACVIIPILVIKRINLLDLIYYPIATIRNANMEQLTLLPSYLLVLFTMNSIWGWWLWLSIPLAIIPAFLCSTLISEIMRRDIKYEFFMCYIILAVLMKSILNLGWFVSLWLPIPLSIILAKKLETWIYRLTPMRRKK